MTAQDTHSQGPSMSGFGQAAMDMIRGAGDWMRRLLIAFAVILAAGLLAVATAMFGLLLAAIAVLMRFTGRHYPQRPARASTSDAKITLEARRTPRGWTVE